MVCWRVGGWGVQVMEDPGLPIGMVNSPQYPCTMPSGVAAQATIAAACMNLSWTPHLGQAGGVYEARLLVTENAAVPGYPCPAGPGQVLSVQIPVTPAASAWVQPAASLLLQPTDPGNTVIGAPFVQTLKCQSTYTPLVTLVSGPGELAMAGPPVWANGTALATYTFSYTPQVPSPGTAHGAGAGVSAGAARGGVVNVIWERTAGNGRAACADWQAAPLRMCDARCPVAAVLEL